MGDKAFTVTAEREASRLVTLCAKTGGSDQCGGSASLLAFIQSRTPDYGMILPTFSQPP